ncbi:MAG: hypothetical protein WC734_06360 [Patescibacteria group bacterium]|jgi:hypothetical protein
MSAITDVGVNFKMEGMSDFQSRLQTLESQWKSFSSAMDKAPKVNEHFQKIGDHVGNIQQKLGGVITAGKAALAALLAFEGAKKALKWGIGNEEVAEARTFATFSMPTDVREAFLPEYAKIREEFKASMADLEIAGYQISSAMAGKPLQEQIEALRTMGYYAKLLGSDFTTAAKFYKGFLAAYGENLPADKRKTFAEDTMGNLLSVARDTQVDPKELALGISQAAPSYSELKVPASRMIAEVSQLMAAMKEPARAGTAARTFYDRATDIVGKVAEAQYKMDYMSGKIQGAPRDWGHLRDLKWKAEHAQKGSQEQLMASHDLKEMMANAPYKGDVVSEQAEESLRSGNLDNFWKLFGPLVKKLRSEKGGFKALEKAVGTELSSAVLILSKGYETGAIQEKDTLGAVSTFAKAKKLIDDAKMHELPEQWALVTQAAETLSVTMKTVFHDPLETLLVSWQKLLLDISKGLTGEGPLGQIKQGMGSLSKGVTESFREAQEKAHPGTSDKSFAEATREKIEGMDLKAWETAGRQIGEAASTFVETMSALKNLISQLSKAIGPLVTPENIGATLTGGLLSKLGDGAIEKALLFTLGAMGYKALSNAPARPSTAEPGVLERETGYNAAGQKLTTPTDRQNYMPSQLQAPTGGWGLPQVNITSQPQVTINCDDQKIKDALKAEVKEEVKTDLQNDQARNRGNANDDGIRR